LFVEDAKEAAILDGMKPICLCKGIRKAVFLGHIRSGVRSVAELKRLTGAGSGSCRGRRCDSRIDGLLREVEHEF